MREACLEARHGVSIRRLARKQVAAVLQKGSNWRMVLLMILLIMLLVGIVVSLVKK